MTEPPWDERMADWPVIEDDYVGYHLPTGPAHLKGEWTLADGVLTNKAGGIVEPNGFELYVADGFESRPGPAIVAPSGGGGGSGGGVVTMRRCTCQPIRACGKDVVPASTYPAQCPIHAKEPACAPPPGTRLERCPSDTGPVPGWRVCLESGEQVAYGQTAAVAIAEAWKERAVVAKAWRLPQAGPDELDVQPDLVRVLGEIIGPREGEPIPLVIDRVLYDGEPLPPPRWDLLEQLQQALPGGLPKPLTFDGLPAKLVRSPDGIAVRVLDEIERPVPDDGRQEGVHTGADKVTLDHYNEIAAKIRAEKSTAELEP